MTKYKIVLVPFPFDDLSSNKVRPAVCLTNPIGPYNHVILAFISSRITSNPLATDFVIDSSAGVPPKKRALRKENCDKKIQID